MNITPSNFRNPSYFEVKVYSCCSPTRRDYLNTYGLNILNGDDRLLPASKARQAVEEFIAHALAHPTQKFMVTRLGPSPNDVAPLFIPVGRKALPHNIYLPQDYWYVIDRLRPAVRKPSEDARSVYAKYMRSAHWQELKQHVYERWGRFCLNCSSDTEIDAHHIRYRAHLEDCTTNDVVPLCRRCHEHYHEVKKATPELLEPIAAEADSGCMVAALRRFFRTTHHRPATVTSVELNKVRLQPGAAHARRWVPYAAPKHRKAGETPH